MCRVGWTKKRRRFYFYTVYSTSVLVHECVSVCGGGRRINDEDAPLDGAYRREFNEMMRTAELAKMVHTVLRQRAAHEAEVGELRARLPASVQQERQLSLRSA